MVRKDAVAPLLVTVVAVLGAWFLFAPGMPRGYDTAMHLFRIVALSQQIRDGVLYPRWFDGLVFGYGYPVFQFYAPLVYYLGEAFYLLGLSFVDSFKAVCFLARIVGGLGTYYFARDTMRSRLAGATAAVAFLLSCYQYTDLVERTALPELLEMNLFPVALWATNRVVTRRSRRDVAVAATLVSCLVLVHQTTAMLSGAGLGAYASFQLVRIWLERHSVREVGFLATRLASVAVLGLVLSSFFWLPALLEQRDVPLDRLPPGIPPFLDQLVSLPDLVQQGFSYVYPFPGFIKLNPVEVALAAVGLVAAFVFRPPFRPLLAFIASCAVASAFGMTTLSRPVWAQLPLVTLMQLPYRLEMYLCFAFALLMGAFALVPFRRVSLAVCCSIVVVLAASTVSQLNTSLRPVDPDTVSTATFARMETGGKSAPMGTTVPTQFLPTWVSVPPESLAESRASTVSPRTTEPLNATVQVLGRSGEALSLAVSTDRPFTFRYHSFYFPDWVATLDGRAASVGPVGPEALLSLGVPGGVHQIELDFGSRSITRAVEGLSTLALAAIVVLIVGKSPHWRGRRVAATIFVAVAVSLLPDGATRVVAIHEPSVHPVIATYSGCLQLAGWESGGEPRSQASVLALTTYWFARCDPIEDREVVVDLIDQSGKIVVHSHRQPHWGASPTSTWYAGELVRDQNDLALPGSLAGGLYTLAIGVGVAGGSPGDSQRVGLITLSEPKAPTSRPLPIEIQSQPIDFSAGLSLAGWKIEDDRTGPPERLRPGETLKVALLLKARDAVPVDGVVSVFLLDNQGKKYSPIDSYPPNDFSYTAAWLPGEARPMLFSLPVPDKLAPGQYSFAVELYDFRTGARLKPIESTNLRRGNAAILKQFTVLMPPASSPTYRVTASFANKVDLEGYDVGVDGATGEHAGKITVDLHWRALQSSLQNYHSFTHLYDRAGKLVTQHDAPLGGLDYPSSIWQLGDTVVDRHTIPVTPVLTPGTYDLRAGLYLPDSAERLALLGGGDTAELGSVVVDPGQLGPSIHVVPAVSPG